MQESHPIALYLFTDSMDSFNLRATEAAMADADFNVKLSPGERRDVLQVQWQPDPIVHPEYQGDGILVTPPAEQHTLHFDGGKAGRQIRRDVSALRAEEEKPLPAALETDGLVHLMELGPADMPRHRIAMLYALLAELAATATQPDRIMIYDPGSALFLGPADTREIMDWRDLLTQLDNPLPIDEAASIKDPDFAPSTQGADAQTPAPAAFASQHGPSPGAQQPSHSWVWLLAGLALAVIGWYTLRG